MSSYFSFAPEHFDNNGDQGNIDALRHFVERQGSNLVEAASPIDSDFVIFGDASRAAMAHYESTLIGYVEILSQRLDRGSPTLLVGSCYEFFWPRLTGTAMTEAARSSEFRSIDTELGAVLGYRNSTLATEDIFIRDGFIGTTLFGPVLAINPELLDRVLNAINLKPASWSQEELELVGKVRSDFTDG